MINNMDRTCYICNETKDLELFVKTRTGPSGYLYRCKKCHNKKVRWRSLSGINKSQYVDLLIKQDSCCAICHKKFLGEPSKLKSVLVADHCHVTGKIRGLLCTSCNFILGHAFDNTQILQSAVEYLKASVD